MFSTLASCLLLPSFPPPFSLALSLCFQTTFSPSNCFIRNGAAEPGWQSLFPAFLFSIFGFEINIIRIFELAVPLASKFAEVRPIVLFAIAHKFENLKVGLGTQVFRSDLK